MKYQYTLNFKIRDERGFRVVSLELLEFIRSVLKPLKVDSGVINNLDGTCTFAIDSDKKPVSTWSIDIMSEVFTKYRSSFSESEFYLNGQQIGGTCHYIDNSSMHPRKRYAPQSL